MPPALSWVHDPVPVRFAILLKLVGAFGIALAAFAVLYSGMSAPIPNSEASTYRGDVLVVAIAMLIHLVYLRTVFSLFLFDRAVERVSPNDFVLPFLLVLVYVLYGVHAFLYNRGLVDWSHRVEIASYLMFVLLYVVWLLKDVLEHEAWQRQWVNIVWVAVDVFVIVLLLSHVFGGFDGVTVAQYGFTAKDVTTIGCIVLLFGLRGFARLVSRANYRSEYEDYLRHNVPAAAPLAAGKGLAVGGDTLRVVDYGCGNGARLIELVTMMRAAGYVAPTARIEVSGFDRDDSWSNVFLANCRAAGLAATFDSRPGAAVDRAASADLVLLSHVLYGFSILRSIRRLLARCREGTLVVVRGTAARSYFTVVNLAFSRRFPTPTVSHLWQSHGLAWLIGAVPLRQVHQQVVEQSYSLADGGDRAARDLLEYLYGRAAGQLAEEYFASMEQQQGASIANHDMLVFLRR